MLVQAFATCPFMAIANMADYANPEFILKNYRIISVYNLTFLTYPLPISISKAFSTAEPEVVSDECCPLCLWLVLLL